MNNVTDSQLAMTLATEAGKRLLRFRETASVQGRALGDAADRVANEFLIEAIAAARPSDAILSEESIDDFARLGAARVWIIDPLDGTREYREGRDDWAVHVALVEARKVSAAAVAIPARNEVFASDSARSESLSHAKRIVISRSRPPAFAARIAASLNAELSQVGSAGAKAMMIVRGEAIAYVHEGGMNEWDAAAPVGVALAHGLHVSDLRGKTIEFNRRDVVLHEGLIICAQPAAQTVLANL